MKIGYLGPRGTYSEKAAIAYAKNDIRIQYHTIEDVINSVKQGDTDAGIVPIENSIEGTVNNTMDMLIFSENLTIQGEVVVTISHDLMVSDKYNGEPIEKIISHAQALGQCRRYLNENYHGVFQYPVSSTAEAAKIVSESPQPWAALGNNLCAEIYGLKTLKKAVQDNEENETCFAVLAKKQIGCLTSGEKTSIAFSTKNEPGALYKVLTIFDLWGINMTKIISRPIKKNIGQYAFFVELEGSIQDEDMQNAIKMVQRKTSFFRLLGSYSILLRV